MAGNLAVRTARGTFNAVFQPEHFVATQTTGADRTLFVTLRTVLRLAWVYVANLLVYAVPLTLGGVGVTTEAAAPAWFRSLWLPGVSDPAAFWQFLVALANNCLFLFALTVLVLGTYHLGVLVTLNSDGIVRTVHTVVYSTSAYLAVMFSVTWYLSQNPAIQVADDLLVWVQKRFFYFFIDLLGASLELPGGRPDPVTISGLSLQGQVALAVLALSALYLLYSLYLGARLNHNTSRSSALLVVLTVCAAPAVYAVGTILVNAAGTNVTILV